MPRGRATVRPDTLSSGADGRGGVADMADPRRSAAAAMSMAALAPPCKRRAEARAARPPWPRPNGAARGASRAGFPVYAAPRKP
ncbi:hypothetical protein GCM10011390_35010 [Aureimonas endophytica]|uniref:Uncharacterized protein n=1 Tax=Aureimonas endophytica TaxID=2027858 RepID=A0A917E7X5_9HYPH|nr:hypothetical protein GCM10011390_35010 [Aureimonas endophytica]